ncbi:hypothetical protein L1887_14659 [Cichorium endivia]|nr:hypothetical protein L1887_14659 [Cichorium endivia]
MYRLCSGKCVLPELEGQDGPNWKRPSNWWQRQDYLNPHSLKNIRGEVKLTSNDLKVVGEIDADGRMFANQGDDPSAVDKTGGAPT